MKRKKLILILAVEAVLVCVLTVLFILFLKYRQRKSDEVAEEIRANCKRTEDYKDRFDSIIE